MEAFFKDDEIKKELNSKIYDKARAMLGDELDRRRITFGISLSRDALRPVVESCYQVEGDGPIIFDAADIINRVRNHLHNMQWPKLREAVAQEFEQDAVDDALANVLQSAEMTIQPVRDYLQSRVLDADAPYRRVYDLAKCARWFDPRFMAVRVQEQAIPQMDFKVLQNAMPLDALTDNDIYHLQQELANYITALQQHPHVPVVSQEEKERQWGICKWWNFRKENLAVHRIPTFVLVFKKLLLLHPNSASVERVFSVLNDALKANQSESLEDKVELTTMRSYNNSKLPSAEP